MTLDPTWTVGLMSSDLGNVYSSDGREHPVLGLTPVYPATLPTAPASIDTGTQPSTVSNASFGVGDLWATITGFFSARHVGARVVVAVVGIGLVFIVALRLTK